MTVFCSNLSTHAVSYEWDFSHGPIDTTFAPRHTYVTGGTYTITLRAYNSVGLFDMATTSVTVPG